MSNTYFNTKKGSYREADAKSFDDLSKDIVDAAFKIHQYYGAGLLESIYEDALCVELNKRNIEFKKQKLFKVYYESVELSSVFKADLVVENQIILELKSVEKITNAHKAQILSYLNISGIETGFIINFGDPYFKRGIERFVMNSSRQLRETSGASC